VRIEGLPFRLAAPLNGRCLTKGAVVREQRLLNNTVGMGWLPELWNTCITIRGSPFREWGTFTALPDMSSGAASK
jgi:hypothetical protein